MRITILTQYFPPEVGAPQNRLYELALRLMKEGHEITVLTAMPNYPSMKIHENYKGKWFSSEIMEDMKVHRSFIYVKDSKSIVPRLMNYFSFVFSSLLYGLIKLRKHDFLLVESPPLFLGISAFILSRLKRSKMIFNVSDLWPESAEKLEIISNKYLLKMATVLEEFLYRKSDIITGQTQGIVSNIKGRFPKKTVYWLPNGVDLGFYNSMNFTPNKKQFGFKEDEFVIAYAGIIGHAQGLGLILDVASKLKEKYPSIKFALLGSGPIKEKLIDRKENEKLDNVEFLDLISKSEMPQFISAVDVALIPLKKLDLFLGAIPSKIFENCAMRKPILLGVDGEAKELFIDKGQAGLFFEPENTEELAQAAINMFENRSKLAQWGENAHQFVEQYFNREKIAKEFNHLLLQEENK